MQKLELFKIIQHVAKKSRGGVSIVMDTGTPSDSNEEVYIIKDFLEGNGIMAIMYEPYGEYIGFKILDEPRPSETQIDLKAKPSISPRKKGLLWTGDTTWEEAFLAHYDPRLKVQSDAHDNLKVIEYMIRRMPREGLKMSDTCTLDKYAKLHARMRMSLSQARSDEKKKDSGEVKNTRRGRPRKVYADTDNTQNEAKNNDFAPFQ